MTDSNKKTSLFKSALNRYMQLRIFTIPSFLVLLLLMFFFNPQKGYAQKNLSADTGKTFAIKNLQALVLSRHPIVKQAALLSDAARARVMQSWGGFDPQLKAAWDKKDFGNINYYNYWQSELKVPIWLAGADIKLGYDRTLGEYINPERRTADVGLSLVGLSIPIGQGLLIDARRNTLKQARIMVDYAEAEKVNQINQVWFNAVKSYWDWYFAYTQYLLIKDGVALAERRFKAISQQTLLGDKPPIDSVEASITVYDRRIQFEKLKADLQNSRLILSNYLWDTNDNPLELPENAKPEPANINVINQAGLDTLVKQAMGDHPELLMLRSQAGQLAIENRFRRELLKPKLNVTGTLLSNKNFFNTDILGYYDFNRSNYKFGIDFAMPLFLRAERGKLKEVRLNQREIDYSLQQTSRNIRNNIVTSYNDLKAYTNQFNLQIQSVNNQQILLNGELQKFELGESTLFVINSRETKLIEMKVKQAEIISDYQRKLAELYFKAGTMQNTDK